MGSSASTSRATTASWCSRSTTTDRASPWLTASGVFERFTRPDSARARGTGGSGLGLAIVAQVAAAHDGSVVADDAPGGGARFTVTLPTERG